MESNNDTEPEKLSIGDLIKLYDIDPEQIVLGEIVEIGWIGNNPQPCLKIKIIKGLTYNLPADADQPGEFVLRYPREVEKHESN